MTESLYASIVIPTFNPSEILMECLAAVYELRIPNMARLELIVVDNNSSAAKHAFIRKAMSCFESPQIRQRLIIERKQGAGHARLRGIHVASCEVVGCLDDDNIPTPNWLTNGARVLESASRLGAIAGLLLPPAWAPTTASFASCHEPLALRTEPEDCCFRYSCSAGIAPPSAGCVVRRTAVLTTIKRFPPLLRGLSREFPLTAEDTELFIKLDQCGWEVWHVPDLVCTHAINPSRFTSASMRKLMRGIGLTHSVLRLIRTRAIIAWLATLPLVLARDVIRCVVNVAMMPPSGDDPFTAAHRWRLFYAAQSAWRGNYHVLRAWVFGQRVTLDSPTWTEVDLAGGQTAK